MKGKYYKEFKAKSRKFSKEDLEVLRLCKEMLKIAGDIFSKQIGSGSPEASFYPRGVTKEEIIKASKKNKDILSPYTVVKRDQRGNLYPVFYHQEYSHQLREISSIAKKAGAVAQDKRLSGYLKLLSKAALDGSWDDLEDYWLGIEGNDIDLQLAPVEPYIDRLFSVKHSFQGTLRVSGDKNKFNPDDYIEVIQALHTPSLFIGKELSGSKVKVRVDDVLARAGYQASLPARGSNYPNNPRKVKKFGTKIIIYTTNIIEREQKTLIPVLKKIISPDILKSYTNSQFFGAVVRSVMMHEIAEALIKYPDSVKRLGDMYLPVKELHASLMGAKVASFHVLKGALSQESYKLMLLIHFIGRPFSDRLGLKKFSGGLDHYVRGYTVAFNYFLENGTVRCGRNYIWVNVPKLFASIDSLAVIFNDFMSKGSCEEAEKFFKKYEDYSFYAKFDKVLRKS